MTKAYRYTILGAVIMTATCLLSCSNESPFISEGDGVLKMNTEVRSDINIVTRGTIAGYEDKYLEDNLVVYIENSKGVIRKYLGYDQIPEAISLPVGTYVVEGWTGDSVSASFDKKFFRGYHKDVKVDAGSNEMSLKLDIANVVVQVDPQSLQQGISDLKVTFYHSRDKLEFGENEIKEEKRGYFMMPNDDTNLSFTIEGKNALGEPFTKTGEIENVERAHLYNMKLTSEPVVNTTGGGLIKLVIEDIPVIEEKFEILPGPYFKATYGQDALDLERQISSTSDPKDFKDVKIRALAYENMEELKIKFDSKILTQIQELENVSETNLMEPNKPNSWNNDNIQLMIEDKENEKSSISGNADIKVVEAWITIKAEFFNKLQANDSEYVIEFQARDKRGYVGLATLKIANSESALADPILSEEAPNENKSPMAILSNSAELNLTLLDDKVQDFGVLYRESGSEGDYNKVSALGNQNTLSTRATGKQYTVKLTGLKENTTYEYKVYADNFIETGSRTFTTESHFEIPNSSMEIWDSYSAKTLLGNKTVIYPGNTGHDNTFWDSGNEGAATANMTLTDKSTTMIGKGTYSACLQSKSALGMIAAGNIFIGQYVETDGTNGVLSLGREYNGSHPSNVKVMANYRPGSSVKIMSGNESYVPDGFAKGKDHGQIYVALTTGPIEIRTNPQKRHLFNQEEEEVVAYGEVTFEGVDFGPDGELAELKIPLFYKENAKTKKATHLIVVCSASKYGDFFSGSPGSTFYLDDFELEYGDIQWQ
ncbi:MAG: PCMD domain-containing protein [Muribaculaceae bacterium]|nr:PCMD domain-containing protein [Muribaculaceae bacterium]